MESYQQSNKRAIVYARMQLHVSFGKAVYLVGNSEETGKWDVSKAYRLTWTSGDIWRGSFTIPAETHLEYKYAVGHYDDPHNDSTLWESGSNRHLLHSDP